MVKPLLNHNLSRNNPFKDRINLIDKHIAISCRDSYSKSFLHMVLIKGVFHVNPGTTP